MSETAEEIEILLVCALGMTKQYVEFLEQSPSGPAVRGKRNKQDSQLIVAQDYVGRGDRIG